MPMHPGIRAPALPLQAPGIRQANSMDIQIVPSHGAFKLAPNGCFRAPLWAGSDKQGLESQVRHVYVPARPSDTRPHLPIPPQRTPSQLSSSTLITSIQAIMSGSAWSSTLRRTFLILSGRLPSFFPSPSHRQINTCFLPFSSVSCPSR
jgi:hypothetical protein